MKILFMGTPDFSVKCLEALINSKHEVIGAVCQPDKPKGRAQTLCPPPVKQTAEAHSIPVYQPASLKNGKGVELLESLKPDIVVVVAYGKILPHDFLVYPKYGCMNIHASLLPKYRGASPIQWSVLNGDEETGVTAMQMDDGVDTGDIIMMKKTKIGENETSEELFERLSVLGAEVLLEALEKAEKGTAEGIKQDDKYAVNVGMLSRQMSPVDWNEGAAAVHNKIRGLYSWPGATCVIDGKTVKLHKSILSDMKGTDNAGEVVFSEGRLVISCGDGKCVEILELQFEGKKRMDTPTFLNGRKIAVGTIVK